MREITLFALSTLLTLCSCSSRFKPGQCIITSDDNYIWKINRIEDGKYVLQGWQGNSWGNDTNLNISIIDKSNHHYTTTKCPELGI